MILLMHSLSIFNIEAPANEGNQFVKIQTEIQHYKLIVADIGIKLQLKWKIYPIDYNMLALGNMPRYSVHILISIYNGLQPTSEILFLIDMTTIVLIQNWIFKTIVSHNMISWIQHNRIDFPYCNIGYVIKIAQDRTDNSHRMSRQLRNLTNRLSYTPWQN